jgi:trehalose 6-phosphate phosphatase
MRRILAAGNRPALRCFARCNLLVALDYDGTLAPIVTDPSRAGMRDSTRDLLVQVARLYPCIVITGRARADAERLLADTGVRAVIGNHGAEPWPGAERFAAEVRRFRRVLERELAGLRGVQLEDKRFSIAVHYRRAQEKQRVRKAVAVAAEELGHVRLLGGKEAINVLPESAPNKGLALVQQRKRMGCDAALYCGDDETDEDVFALGDEAHLLGIRVGSSVRSRARYYVRSQREVDSLLRELVALRGAVS